MNIPHVITIKPVVNGYLLQVGCQQVVFQNRSEMISELQAYLEDPGAVMQRYGQNAVHAILVQPNVPQPNDAVNLVIPPPAGPATVERAM